MTDINRIIMLQEAHIGQGGLRDPEDARDYRAGDILAGVEVEVPWQKGYNALVDAGWPDMPNKHQGVQFSCVGQSWAHYKQVLQAADTKEHTELSAKSIYNPIAIPGKGSYIRDGGLRTVSYGVNKEEDVPSGGSEAEVTAKFVFDTHLTGRASIYKNLTTASVNTQDFDELGRMIVLNKGIVSGFDGHCMYFKELGIMGGKRYIKSHNSYGAGSDVYYFEGSGQPSLYSAWTAVDMKNMPQKGKLRLVRKDGDKLVWFLLNNKRYHVINPTMMADGLVEGIWDGFSGVEVITSEELESYPIVRIPVSDYLRVLTAK